MGLNACSASRPRLHRIRHAQGRSDSLVLAAKDDGMACWGVVVVFPTGLVGQPCNLAGPGDRRPRDPLATPCRSVHDVSVVDDLVRWQLRSVRVFA